MYPLYGSECPEGYLNARDVTLGREQYSFCIRQHLFTFYLGKEGEQGTVAVLSSGEMAAALFQSVAGLQYCIAG